jgi:ribonuclease Y
MITVVVVLFLGLFLGVGIEYLILKSLNKKRFEYLEMASKAKARRIEEEAEKLLRDSEVEIKERELEQKKVFAEKLEELENRKRALILKEKELDEALKKVRRDESIL